MNAYAKLINEVKKVNRQAALYMKRRLPLLNMRGRLESGLGVESRLTSCFIFDETKQGVDYWFNIVDQLPREFQ